MIIVEVLGRGGRVVERVRLAALPATIGRGYGNDVVLDDPYVDASHARIEQDEAGRLVVTDLGSVNGLLASEHGARADRIALAPGATFRVGHTALRVATPDVVAAPALRDPGAGSRWRRLAHSRGAALLLTIVVAPLLGLSLYLDQTDTGRAAFALDTLGVLGVVLAWTGIWAAITRVRLGDARFLAHLSVAWVVFAVSLIIAEAAEWLRFIAAGSWIVGAGIIVATILTVAVIINGHLAIASRLARRTRLAAGAGAAVLLLVLGAVAAMGIKSDRNDIVVDMPLKPLPARMVPAQSVDAFLARAAAVQKDVDKEADESP